MLPMLRNKVDQFVYTQGFTMGAGDFAFYQQVIPDLLLSLGVLPAGVPMEKAAPNHSPYFTVNESALVKGVELLSMLALDYLSGESE